MSNYDRALEFGLFEAFKPDQDADNESVLTTINRLHGTGASILLKQPEIDDNRVAIARSDSAPAEDSRFLILGEIARGGVGVIYHSRDRDLNRDVALKVLREDHKSDADVTRRFIEEAQVGGQLQHPGIAPVYTLHVQPDGRPCFAMKLIKGQTLAALLENNQNGIDLLAVFEQITQTMAYAHSRGVIHRDLKPANVMVGAFGEVQVVDWGFAKLLGGEDIAAPANDRTEPPAQTIVTTIRSGAEGSRSIAGSVMGTPGYMPPEQALGHVADMDERADVFALGAILCEILTGAPPYTGESKDQMIAAAQCRTDAALLRLDACAATDGLRQIVRDCLQSARGDRPQNAGAVAALLAGHFGRVEERTKQAELDAIRAQADAARQAKGRRRSLVLSAFALTAVGVAGGGWYWVESEANARAEIAAPRIEKALAEAGGHEGRATNHELAGKWQQAVTSARQAVDVAQQAVAIAAFHGVNAALAQKTLDRLQRRSNDVVKQAQARADDARFLAVLAAIRGRHDEAVTSDEDGTKVHQGDAETDRAYTLAFTAEFESVEESAQRLLASDHRAEFAAHLGYWCWVRKALLKTEGWQRIDRLAREIDPDNANVRKALINNDGAALLAIVAERGDDLPTALAALVGEALASHKIGQAKAALAFLEGQWQRAPDDFHIHLALAHVARKLRDFDRNLVHTTAAVALRPNSSWAWVDHCSALNENGEFKRAIAAAQKAIHIDSMNAIAHNNLGVNRMYDGDLDGAVETLQRALAITPASKLIHRNLGTAFRKKGEFGKAIAAFRKALDIDPKYLIAHNDLGLVHADMGNYKLAIAAFDAALSIDSKFATAHHNIGDTRRRSGDLVGAIAAFQKATQCDPKLAIAYHELGTAHAYSGEPGRAIDPFQRAIEIDPNYKSAHFNLGTVCIKTGDFDRAMRAFRRTIEIDPELASAHNSIGFIHQKLGDYKPAIAAYRRAIDAGPNLILPRVNLRRVLREQAEPVLKERLEQLLAGATVQATPLQRVWLAKMLYDKQRYRASVLQSELAFQEDAKLAADAVFGDRYNAACSAVLAGVTFHERAANWLAADLLAFRDLVASDRAWVQRKLLHWKRDSDLAAIRDEKDLPPACKKLWADVDALLEEVRK